MLWTSPEICAYDWSNWKGFLIRAIWPNVRRIRADFNESAQEVAQRLPRSTRILLLHLNISVLSPFIADTPSFADVLLKRNVTVLNCHPTDIRKRTLQSMCREFGLPSVATEEAGPDEEMLIVKTDFNSGGRQEQLLSPGQRAQFHFPAQVGRMKSPRDYFVGPRRDITPDIWRDPTLVVERFMNNPLNRFFRVYATVNSVVISEAYTDSSVKRMEGRIRRHNHFLWREGARIVSRATDVAMVPPRLIEVAGIFLDRFQLHYGAVDFVESECGEFYAVDLNRTPYWGDEKQRGMIEHLRLGFSDFLEDSRS
jgi:hypothetical protein